MEKYQKKLSNKEKIYDKDKNKLIIKIYNK